MSFARDERIALCDLLDETGPGAPTLCEGWRTVDLAAHLVLREHRPDAAAGVMGGPLASHTGRVQRTLIAHNPYRQLVDEIRKGPPRLSVFAIPGMDERLNMVEYFVHRGRPARWGRLAATRDRCGPGRRAVAAAPGRPVHLPQGAGRDRAGPR